MTQMTIHTTLEIDATAAQTWAVLGEGFDSWDAWAPGIERSTLEGELGLGAVRVNETPSLGTVRQELVVFDRERRALAYEMRSGLPPFFSGVRNDWTLEALEGGRCQLQGVAVFELREPQMQAKLEGKMGMALEVFATALRDHVQGS